METNKKNIAFDVEVAVDLLSNNWNREELIDLLSRLKASPFNYYDTGLVYCFKENEENYKFFFKAIEERIKTIDLINELVYTNDIEKFKRLLDEYYSSNEMFLDGFSKGMRSIASYNIEHLLDKIFDTYKSETNYNAKLSHIAKIYSQMYKEYFNINYFEYEDGDVVGDAYDFISEFLNYQSQGCSYFEDISRFTTTSRRNIASELYENKKITSREYNKIMQKHKTYNKYKQLQLFFLLFSLYIEE